jgi:hypothetical protein
VIVRPVAVTAESKAATFGAIRLMIHREQLLVPESAVELRRELLLLKVELTPQGLERIETGGRDFASALALASGPYRHRGEWKNLLLQMSERAAGQRPATVPEEVARLPHVITGGGLSLPRTPAWEGFAGDEITLPPGAAAAETDSKSEAAARREAAMEALRERVRATLKPPHKEVPQ